MGFLKTASAFASVAKLF